MLKSGRKFCGLLIFLVVLTVVFSVRIIAETSIDYCEEFDDTSVDGLDIVWAKESDTFGVLPVYDNGEMYAVKSWVSATRPVRMTHSLGTSVNSGMFYVSFDFYTTERYNDCYLRLLSGDKQFQICGFRNKGNFEGKFGHFIDFSKWALDSNTAVEYSPDTWYTVGVLFDMEERVSYFYFGEQDKQLSLIETVALNDDFKNITDVVLVHSFGDYTPAMWDNICVRDVNTNTIEDIETKEKLVFEKAIYEKYIDDVYFEDFETDKLPDLGMTAWSDEKAAYGALREENDDGYGVKTWVDSAHPVRLTHSFEKPLNEGIYYISFDYRSEGAYNDCYLRLLSGEDRFQICGFRADGNFGRFVNFTNWALNHDTEVAYSPDQWYTVGFLMDFDLGKAYIYLGKKDETLTLIEETELGESFTNITDMVLVHSYGQYPVAKWDNIKVYGLAYETMGFIEDREKVSFDESVTDRIICVLKTSKAGNIFHNTKTAEVVAKYYNRSMVYKDIDVDYEAFYNGESIFKNSKKIKVETENSSEDIIALPVEDKYGFFEVNVLAESGKETLSQTRISNARTAKDGVRNSKIGTTIHMTRVEDKEAAFEILEKGGFTVVRGGQNDWSDVETAKNVFTKTDRNSAFYAGAVNDGFEAMTILKGSNELYAGEFPTDNPDRAGKVENPPKSDELIEKFGEYCYQTVVMYPDVKYFQIWNEWNNAPTFNNDGITGASYYAKLLKAGYDGVKRGEKDRGKEALVVAMAPTGTKPEWIENVFKELNQEKCFDVISVHPYTYQDGGVNGESAYAPEDVCVRHSKESGDVVTRLKAVYSILEKYGYQDVPLWAGEFGFSSYVCGEEEQAQYAVRMMALCDGNGLLDKMLWYTFQNHASVNETEQNYGMVRFDENVLVPYEAKPSYLAMSNYNALMANAKISRTLSDGEDNVYAYEFTARDGGKVYTVWTTEGEKEYTLKTDSSLVNLYDIYGNETVLVTKDGGVTLKISENMSYIKVSEACVGLVQNSSAVAKISDLTEDDVFLVSSAPESEDISIFVAQYQNDILTNAEIYEINGEDINIGKIDSGVDRICVFMWKNMSPICEKLIIE